MRKKIRPPRGRVFGIVLRRIRRDRNTSQQALADKSGYHRTYIGLLEGGQKGPSLRTIFDNTTALQVIACSSAATGKRLASVRSSAQPTTFRE